MRVPQIVRDFFEWRWAPCVALTVGSLAYVGLAVLLIPSQIDGGSGSSNLPASFDRSAALPNTAFAAPLAQNSLAAPPTAHEPMLRSPPPANDPMGAPRRGFSPPIVQPEAPAPPPPPPPPPPPVQAAPPPTPQPVLNQPPPTPPQDQAATPPPAPPPPPNGDEAAQPPPATQ